MNWSQPWCISTDEKCHGPYVNQTSTNQITQKFIMQKEFRKGVKLGLPERRNFLFQELKKLSNVTDNSDESFNVSICQC